MSSLWTPSGEHPVPRTPAGGAAGADSWAGEPQQGADPPPPRAPAGRDRAAEAGAREPTAQHIQEAEAELDAVREQLLQAPVEIVISNHAMGLWELAALHLSQKPPNLAEAQLAIDALSALIEGLGGRLGEAEKTLGDGLAEIRMAFVQIVNAERARQ
ncbi:MAG: hypothetical protein ACRDX8_14840, partial [Acidimicrobiales bacterium]